MSIVREFRIPLPLTLEEFRIGQLYSVAQTSKNETGGGEGVEIVTNEPVDDFEGHGPAQYTHKIYHLQSKVPSFVRCLAPMGSLELHEKSWNAYPFCKTEFSNDYMKDNFKLEVLTWHKPGKGEIHNVHNLPEDHYRDNVHIEKINIWDTPYDRLYHKPEWDPRLVRSEKTCRGPLEDANWKETADPVMCAYKLVSVTFNWFGLQERVENTVMKQAHMMYQGFYRQAVCWLDEYHGMTMDDIRNLEYETKRELDEARAQGDVKGMIVK